MEKPRGQQSRATVPLRTILHFHSGTFPLARELGYAATIYLLILYVVEAKTDLALLLAQPTCNRGQQSCLLRCSLAPVLISPPREASKENH